MKTSCMLVAKVHIGLPVVTYHFLGSGKSWPPLMSRLWVTSDALRSSNDITKVVKRQLADGAAASLGLRDGNHRGHDGDRPIVNVSGLASSTWCPACSSCITGARFVCGSLNAHRGATSVSRPKARARCSLRL
uniref:Uncharacterized protein n=1 Tax=Prymnesium polylepis TaxID=72548 RepID=A0A7S4HD33_9EUKA